MATMAAILKIYFMPLLLNQKGKLTPNLLGSIGVTCRSKIAKIVPRDGRHGGHLENLFFDPSPEPKDHLTRHLVGSIWVTCR